jgi:hypothetical protein
MPGVFEKPHEERDHASLLADRFIDPKASRMHSWGG